MIDWKTLLGEVSAVEFLAILGLILASLWYGIKLIGWIWKSLLGFWPWIKGFIRYGDALAALPAFIDRTDTRFDKLEGQMETVHHELSYNQESSVKDAVHRVELGVRGLYDKVDELNAADADIRKELEDTRPHNPREEQ
jgi:hypothetical protein